MPRGSKGEKRPADVIGAVLELEEVVSATLSKVVSATLSKMGQWGANDWAWHARMAARLSARNAPNPVDNLVNNPVISN
jgi:hypothetical protein